MNVLVTGCSGFIGSNLIEELLKSGHFIVGLDNMDDYYLPAIKEKNLEKALAHPNFRFVPGDIRDENVVNGLLEEFEITQVIHLAARAGVRPSIENPLLYADVNVKGTNVLLEGCRKYNITKFLFASSSSVYGNNLSVPFKESDNVDHPISPYAATKKAGELLCYTYHKLFQMDIFCLRFFTVYGPRQRPEMAISKFIQKIKDGETIDVYAQGQTLRDYTYVGDIVNGIILAMNKLKGYDIFNIGGSSPVKLLDLIRIIEDQVGKKADLNLMDEQPGDVDITYADTQKVKKELGFETEVSMEKGISLYLKWLQA